MEYSMIYEQYVKPSWAPPAWLFGPVWTFLYITIFISLIYLFVLYKNKKIKKDIVGIYILNLFLNVIFTPIQFGLMNMILATIDIVLIWSTLAWFILRIKKVDIKLALLQLPYFFWVSFAMLLQFTVTMLN